MNPRVKFVQYQPIHRLIITFNNNEVKVFDITPYLQFSVYKKLNDLTFCSLARAEHGTVIWDDETDFDPDILYLESKALSSINA